MDTITNLFATALTSTWVSFTHNWPFLIFSVIMAVALKLFLKPEKVSAILNRNRGIGVVGATAVAVTTPFCSCGTTAVILGMIAGAMPWAPIIAFMVASPLTSPEELIYSAGLFGWRFAWAFFGSSILLGLLGGLAGAVFESRGWLKNQARFLNEQPGAASRKRGSEAPVEMTVKALDTCACSLSPEPVGEAAPETCSCSSQDEETPCGCSQRSAVKLNQPTWWSKAQPAVNEGLQMSLKLALMFIGFAFVGYFINGLIPAGWMASVFGSGQIYSVPLAATLGLPLYFNTEASMPLVKAMIDGGMSEGAALAFLITGAGTSIGAVGGALTIARWKVIALVVGVLWVGAIAMGLLWNFMG